MRCKHNWYKTSSNQLSNFNSCMNYTLPLTLTWVPFRFWYLSRSFHHKYFENRIYWNFLSFFLFKKEVNLFHWWRVFIWIKVLCFLCFLCIHHLFIFLYCFILIAVRASVLYITYTLDLDYTKQKFFQFLCLCSCGDAYVWVISKVKHFISEMSLFDISTTVWN